MVSIIEIFMLDYRLKFDSVDPSKFVGLECKASIDFYTSFLL